MYVADLPFKNWIRSLMNRMGPISAWTVRVLESVTSPAVQILDRILGPLDRLGVPYPVVLVAGFALILLLLSPNIAFNLLRDEGYLWYGAQRVLAGEIPFRDFQSYYDPARYYLTAAVMAAFGSTGILAFWKAIALFGATAAALAGQLVFRKSPRPSLAVVLAVTATLYVWMFPESYKLLDICASLILVGLLAWLIEQPSHWRCFAAGLAVGLIAIVGRNHGLYGSVADVAGICCVALVEKRTRLLPALAWWAAGVFVGYLPMLLALAFVPGLWWPFFDSIRIYFVLGTTNLGLPVPWPWLVPAKLALADKLRYIVVGALFILQPLFGLTVVMYSVWRAAVRKIPINPVLFASALLALIYMHLAYSRPGIEHLAQSIYPLLVALFVIVLSKPKGMKIAFASVICALSVFVELHAQPLYNEWLVKEEMPIQLGPDTVGLPSHMAYRIMQLTALVNQHAPFGREFVAVPHLPGLYAIFDRRAAVWASYQLSPAMVDEQKMEIARIEAEHPGVILVQIEEQDRRSELGYWNTDPLVLKYILSHFNRLPSPHMRPQLMVFVPPQPPKDRP